MMMSKPEENTGGEKLAPPAPLKTQAAADSVKDLERRLQLISEAENKPAAAAPKPAPKSAAPPAAAAAAGGGKNALLVRKNNSFCFYFARRLHDLTAVVSRQENLATVLTLSV